MIILFVRMTPPTEAHKYKTEILKNTEILNLTGEILMKRVLGKFGLYARLMFYRIMIIVNVKTGRKFPCFPFDVCHYIMCMHFDMYCIYCIVGHHCQSEPDIQQWFENSLLYGHIYKWFDHKFLQITMFLPQTRVTIDHCFCNSLTIKSTCTQKYIIIN